MESLLSVIAVDSMDPAKRVSDLNRDLFSVGVANTLVASIGGLPMISEIVRSRANVDSGATGRQANFFHGLFLLVFVAAFPTLIHSIPLASLAAILMFTGYRLAAPQHFKHTLHIGSEQLAIFITTLVITLATDLIIGVFSGILLKIFIHLFRGAPLRSLFRPKVNVHYEAIVDRFQVDIHNVAVFSNYLSLKSQLDQIPRGKDVRVNFDNATLVDHTVMEHLHTYQERYNRAGGTMELEEMGHLIPRSQHPLSARKGKKKPVY